MGAAFGTGVTNLANQLAIVTLGLVVLGLGLMFSVFDRGVMQHSKDARLRIIGGARADLEAADGLQAAQDAVSAYVGDDRRQGAERVDARALHEATAPAGTLAFEAPNGARAVVWQEYSPAKFRRSLRLGASIDASKVQALYHNGLLTLTMPKAEHSKPRQIQVQVTSKEAKVG
jgi:hypothetical protein